MLLLTYSLNHAPLKGLHDLDPKGVIKVQHPNIAIFGIKLKVLMRTLTLDVYDLHLNVKL